MLLLVRNVGPNRGGTRLAYGESAVAGLPCKNVVFGPTPVHPPRRIRFYQASDIRDGVVGGHANQEMDVIAGSIHAKSGPSNLTDDASKVGVQIFFELGFDEGAALFGAEDEMDQEVGGGVWHSFLSPLRGFAPSFCC
jgi:hypothetical protein